MSFCGEPSTRKLLVLFVYCLIASLSSIIQRNKEPTGTSRAQAATTTTHAHTAGNARSPPWSDRRPAVPWPGRRQVVEQHACRLGGWKKVSSLKVCSAESSKRKSNRKVGLRWREQRTIPGDTWHDTHTIHLDQLAGSKSLPEKCRAMS